jgi:hypothetical protein
VKQNKIELKMKNKQTMAQQEHSQTARIRPVVKDSHQPV